MRLMLAVLLVPVAASADTPAGAYLATAEVHSPKLSTHPDGLSSCTDASNGQVKRLKFRDGEGPKIEYVKSAHRVRVGSVLFDFIGDDDEQVGATTLSGDDETKMLTYVHFWRVNESTVAIKLELDAAIAGKVQCGDYYWFKGTYEKL